MAYPAGMLIRKDGNIRFHYRIPKDLQQHYPKSVVSENLGTSDKTVTAQLIYKRKAELEREFSAHRTPRLPLKTSITVEEAKTLASQMLASIANADEELRHLGLTDSLIGEWSEDTPHRERELDGVKSAASKGGYSFLTPLVEDWLQSNGYVLSAGSPDFKLTEREFGKTLQQAVAINLSETMGSL